MISPIGDESTTLIPNTTQLLSCISVKDAISRKDAAKTTSIGKSTTILYDIHIPEPDLLVYFDDVDVTPKILGCDKFQLGSKYNLETNTGSAFRKVSKVAEKSSHISSQTQRFSQSSIVKNQDLTHKRMTMNISLDNIKVDRKAFCDVGNEDKLEVCAPSAFYLPRAFSKKILPKKITVYLEETDTISLLEMPSITVAKGTHEGDLIEKDNEIYDYLTIGKGRNRKTKTTEVQTIDCILKTRHTLMSKPHKSNNSAFASIWDLYDSYASTKNDVDMIGSIDSINFNDSIIDTIGDDHMTNEEKNENEANKILTSTNFLNATMMMERILANNNFTLEQEDFKGLVSHENEEGDEEIQFNYDLHLLWTFSFHELLNKTVTSLSINPTNTDIMAVGYGKCRCSEKSNGIICVWSIKNPTQPERLYRFEFPVTSTAFSAYTPNLLAVGFYNGEVLILDITTHFKNVLAKSSRRSCLSFEPIWNLQWYFSEDYNIGKEQVISVGQDGRINCFFRTKTNDFYCTSIMRIIYTDGNTKSTFEEDWCPSNEIPILRNTVAFFYCRHPTLSDIYFIGTADGYIYKCSVYYLNQHIHFFLAHDGPIYEMQFSPHCPTIFVTCGADSKVKIWRENVMTPLIILTTNLNSVAAVKFSPTHSTVIAAISDNKVYLWNIKHKVDTTIYTKQFPNLLLKVNFTGNGSNLILADKSGNVHMFSVLGIEEPEDCQECVLENTIHKILLIRPELLLKLKKADKIVKWT